MNADIAQGAVIQRFERAGNAADPDPAVNVADNVELGAIDRIVVRGHDRFGNDLLHGSILKCKGLMLNSICASSG